MTIHNTISSDYDAVETRLRESAEMAQHVVEDEQMLVAAIHPDVNSFMKDQIGLDEDAELRGVGGIRHVMVTESVPGFAVVICNENL